jgi:two-component system chemotaxis response regulator CheY
VRGAATSCINILLVDDNKTMLRIMRNLVTQLGFATTCVREASDGPMALSQLRGKDYALVISDWNMGPVSGLQLLKEGRADVKLKSIPFVMASDESTAESVAAAEAAGVSSYVVKPFNAQTLGRAISAAGGPSPEGGIRRPSEEGGGGSQPPLPNKGGPRLITPY